MIGKKTIGIVFGRFIRYDAANMAAVDRSVAENNETFIGVSGCDMDPGRDTLPFLRRVRLMRDIFQCRPDIRIAEIDEDGLDLEGRDETDKWRAWAERLFQAAVRSPERTELYDYTWYVRTEQQAEMIRAVFPEHKTVLLDPVPGTAGMHPMFEAAIRKNEAARNRHDMKGGAE